MAVRVLVVDDSAFFRRRITSILNADPEIEVIGAAMDGEQAIRRVKRLKPDLVTMDVEMPVMDGISAVKQIMRECPVPVVMLSAMTTSGAKASLDALEAGAVDVLPKPQGADKGDGVLSNQLCQRIKMIARQGVGGNRSAASTAASPAKPVASGSSKPTTKGLSAKSLDLVVIGSSTGGPVVVQTVLSSLPKNFPLPIVVIQHMPASFVPSFAERLDRISELKVRQSIDGEAIETGHVYVVPGGIHTEIVPKRGALRLQSRERLPSESFCPSVDIAFESASKASPGRVLALVFTGMGADGCIGAKSLKSSKSTVWAQSEASCTIYGMPRAVIEAKLADRILDIPEFGRALSEL